MFFRKCGQKSLMNFPKNLNEKPALGFSSNAAKKADWPQIDQLAFSKILLSYFNQI